MTAHKDLKAHIRAHGKAADSNYQVARRHVLAKARFRRVVNDVIEWAKRWCDEETRLEEGNSVWQTLLDELAGNGPSRPAARELESYLQSLTDADLHAVGTLMYLGRDFRALGIPQTTEEILKYHRSLRWQLDARLHVIDQLIEKLPLAEYLIDGLRVARTAGFDLETLPELAAAKLSITCTRCGAPMRMREQPAGQPYKPWTVVTVPVTASNADHARDHIRHFCGDCSEALPNKDQRKQFVREQLEGKHLRSGS